MMPRLSFDRKKLRMNIDVLPRIANAGFWGEIVASRKYRVPSTEYKTHSFELSKFNGARENPPFSFAAPWTGYSVPSCAIFSA